VVRAVAFDPPLQLTSQSPASIVTCAVCVEDVESGPKQLKEIDFLESAIMRLGAQQPSMAAQQRGPGM